MNSTQRLTTARKYCLCITFVFVAILALPALTYAGSGTFKNGQFDFCISVRFNASAAQLQQIRDAFQNASQILSDATDGQHRFGTITIVNDSGASESAEYWIHPGRNRAYATEGNYGVRGEHVNLWFDNNIAGASTTAYGDCPGLGAIGADGIAYTIAHEHAHHAYGVLDEYSGPAGAAECAEPKNEAPDLNYCLMDSYGCRGGRLASVGYTLNEFCVASNHDMDGDTFQRRRSCWAQIDASKHSINAPAGLPQSAPPSAHTVQFEPGHKSLRVILVLDRSGSMVEESRLVFAKRGANLFIDFLQNGDSVGVVSFADSGTVNFGLTTITGGGTKTSAKAAVSSLNASGGTNIGGGLQAALGQITSQADHSCNNIIVLLSDGDHNTGTQPASVIPGLQEAGVTVLSVGLGSGISSGGQATLQNLANQTGGKFFRVSGAFDLIGLFLRLVNESIGNGLLTRSPQTISTGQVREIATLVEAGTQSATFAVTIADSTDAITLSLQTPSGAVITEANASSNSNVEFISDANSRTFRINAPDAGTWKIVISAGTIRTGNLEILSFADHDGVDLNASVEKDTLVFPEVVAIKATPRFDGESVVGAMLFGTVTRPGGSKVSINLFDDGLEAHGDAVPNDGAYATLFNQYNGDGTYTFDLTAVVINGRTFSGEDLFSSEPSNERPVPQFTRSASTTAVITGVPLAQLNASSYSVNESSGRASITIVRTGNTAGPATVNYSTVDDPAPVRCDVTNGIAYPRCDYSTTVDTLLFAAGEEQKTFNIPIVDDAHIEGMETLMIKLDSAAGATIGTQNMATLTITDNDTAPRGNPIFELGFFVHQHYIDFLNREPEQTGFDAWVAVLNGCSNVDTNPACDRVEVSASFFRSPEFNLKGYYVHRYYKVSFGRLPRYNEIVPDMLSVTGQTSGEVIAKRQEFAAHWVERQGYRDLYDNLTNAAFVDKLLSRYGMSSITTPVNPDDLNSPLVTLTRNTLVEDLEAQPQRRTRIQVLRAIVESREVDQVEYNCAFVAAQYFGYLRRDPEQDGYNAWLRVLNQFPRDDKQGYRLLVHGFVNSFEYQLRFGQPR